MNCGSIKYAGNVCYLPESISDININDYNVTYVEIKKHIVTVAQLVIINLTPTQIFFISHLFVT